MPLKPCILLMGTCDTKLQELLYTRNKIIEKGDTAVLLVDVGRTPSDHANVDFPSSAVLQEMAKERASKGDPRRSLPGQHSWDIPDLSALSRGEVINLMIQAGIIFVGNLYSDDRIHGMIALGGSGGTSIAASVMREALPYGFPKLIVSTVASGDTRSFIGESDSILVPSVVDIAGLNSLLKTIIENAAAAVVAMAKLHFERSSKQELRGTSDALAARKELKIAISMFGVTTPGVTAAVEYLKSEGHETFVFHATGTGGSAMEKLISEGLVDGVLDMTTTELADELVGGIMSAGSSRLTAAGKKDIPQIISVGALDMVNFGARSSVPEKFGGRKLVEHNPSITLMRTTREECAKLGEVIAGRLRGNCKNAAKVEVWIPKKGVSMIAEEGQVFYDKEADDALFDAIRKGLDGSGIGLREEDAAINDPAFATAMVKRLLDLIKS